MCTECAVLTPVGYRCRECFYNQQTVFYPSTTRDYVVAAGAGFALSAVGAVLLWILADFRLWLALLLGFPAGGGIAEAIMRLNQNRKGRKLWMAAVAAVIAGGLILFIPPAQFIIEYTGYGYELMTVIQFIAGDLIAPVVYTVLTALAVYLRLR
jgi:Na+/phosphate symporter